MPQLLDLTGRSPSSRAEPGSTAEHIVAALAEVGAHVVVAARDVGACDDGRGGAREQGWMPASARSLDLADEASIAALCAGVVDEHGAIDVLVNNAVARRRRRPST